MINTQSYKKVKDNQPINQPFSLHLQSAIQSDSKLVLSKHAKERLSQRNIEISEEKWTQIEEKVSKAKKMGVKDSLVILNNAALIVSAKNNTVITAMDRVEAASQIFTNINGTILVDS
ncbi:MAG: TIGR02530 family flagellar biosynthesis protein [Bacillota bacterium]|nr:TIGR02530 family flagellar biosynthesis protein [Bacillota bacterium]